MNSSRKVKAKGTSRILNLKVGVLLNYSLQISIRLGITVQYYYKNNYMPYEIDYSSVTNQC